jgi:hypothetical protein
MKITDEDFESSTLVQSVAGEDLRVGEFVTLLNSVCEYPSFLWDASEHTLPPTEVVRLKYIPKAAGQPLKIIGICLPFVYVRKHNKVVEIIDLRLNQVVRMNSACAKEIWRAARSKSSNE